LCFPASGKLAFPRRRKTQKQPAAGGMAFAWVLNPTVLDQRS